MEVLAIIAMIVTGVAIAMFVLIAFTLARRAADHELQQGVVGDRDHLAASLLHHVLAMGGMGTTDAMRAIRRGTGLAARVSTAIDVTTWGERYAQVATPAQRSWLLDAAVQLAVAQATTISLLQYSALLDLSFALGFHTDALARLRERYHFDYIDPAKAGRPRGAGREPLFVRDRSDRADLLRLLELQGEPSRQEIITAYRHLVAEIHPDRVHGQPLEVQEAAAARFIEITRAYEALLSSEDRV
ncbi:MAG: J domain-containing protein [Thermoanaerobaculia bacterium]